MMRRGFGIAMMTALLALSLPLSVIAAQDGGGDHGHRGNDHGHRGKITICHMPQGTHPVTITISTAAWKAHKAHRDTQGPCPTSPKPPKPPKPAQGTCTFDALTSIYNNGATSTSPLYATGRIHFPWTVATGLVTVPGGSWNELIGATTYFNNITSGSVSGTGAVSLSFVRTVPDSNAFSFSGQLTGNTLTGLMAGNYFTATGTVNCNGTGSTATTCTFDALTSIYNNGATSTSPLYATGPIHFPWTVATGLVTVPGGSWNELIGTTTYFNNTTSGSVSGTGAVSLSFVRTVPDSNTFSFSGQLTGNTLTGLMAGNYFTATGTVNCNGTGSHEHDDD